MLTQNSKIGEIGELAAIDWLRAHGHLIMEHNWRHHPYEIDIVTIKQGVIHIIEVRTRRDGGMLSPIESLSIDKCESVKRAARLYLSEQKIRKEYQLDFIGIEIEPSGDLTISIHEEFFDLMRR